MAIPKCPVHEVEMVLRTARRGKNAGGRFWSCPTWAMTRCDKTVPFEGDGGEESGRPQEVESASRFSLPRQLRARSRFQGFQVRFFESVAVPEDVLEDLLQGSVIDSTQREISQWRIDYPSTSRAPAWTERQRQVLSVAEKLLTRGHVTRCSPTLETEFRRKFHVDDGRVQASPAAWNQVLRSVQNPSLENWCDSSAEKIFFETFLAPTLGVNFPRWVTPQVELTSLVPPERVATLTGRVDFLICHPDVGGIVVEIDGEQHRLHTDADAARDAALAREGYRVIRIPCSELQHLQGESLSTLKELLAVKAWSSTGTAGGESNQSKFIHATKVSHQIQLVILQAIQTGFLSITDSSEWQLSTDLERTGWFSGEESLFMLESAVHDLLALLRNLSALYSLTICQGAPRLMASAQSDSLQISFTGHIDRSHATFVVQNVSAPFHIASAVLSANPATLAKPSQRVLEYFLSYLYRKPSFWEGQVDAITRTLEGKDSIVLLPTGAGKSIAFQLASLLLPGPAVVIAPIISLMDDQVDNLRAAGVDRAVAITSQIADPHDRARILALVGQGEYLFAYIAPERFQTVEFRESLRSLTVHTPVSLIAVDEAHCVSEWGHDFRTAYLNIGRTSRTYCESNGVTPPLLALTGTASRAVLKDVQRELKIDEFDAIITPKSFDRPELKFHISKSSSAEKSARLLGYLGQALPSKFACSPASFFQASGKETSSGLIFCPHVNGDHGVVRQAESIRRSLGIPVEFYCGDPPKHWTGRPWEEHKRMAAHRFKRNEVSLLVCTKAFGMGIDKPNIRFTVHFGIPFSIESFYQEAGRAGRDRKIAHCCILVSDDNPRRSKTLLDPNTKIEEVHKVLDSLAWEEADDVTRALYFQTLAFPGISREKESMAQVLEAIGDVSKNRTQVTRLTPVNPKQAEKCIHRLVVLGIVSDYTIRYASEEFAINICGATKQEMIEAYGRYVAGYLGSRRQVEEEKASTLLALPFVTFILQLTELLIHFVYDVIEQGRRRALREMVLAATLAPTDSSMRQRILSYLEQTQYSEALDQVLAASDAGLEATRDVFERVRSSNDAAELRGQVARYLESYPDHPGLLMLRAVSEMCCRDRNAEAAKEDFKASLSASTEKYRVSESSLISFIAWSISKISGMSVPLAKELQAIALAKHPTRTLARQLVKGSTVTLALVPAWFLVGKLTGQSIKIISK